MFPDKPRIILDTSVLISSILLHASVPSQAARLAFRAGIVLTSEETLAELASVLARPTISATMTADQARDYLAAFAAATELVSVTAVVVACRDPNDDKFLALAQSGQAEFIVTGDADLLTLNPFQGVAIMTPRQFLDAFPADISISPSVDHD